jgi:CspA family cold shock protein
LVDVFFSNRPCVVFSSRRVLEVNVTTGTVKRVISERGFGFIAGEDGKEYFFHRDGLSPSVDFDRLVGGESVSFEVEKGPKGDRAVQVQSA